MGYNGTRNSLNTNDQPEASAQDQEIFDRRINSQSVRDIAKAMNLTVKEVDAALIRACPRLDADSQLVAWNLEIARLERLAAVHYKKAFEADIPSTVVITKLNERISALRGWDVPAGFRRDPIMLQLEAAPPLTTSERIDRAIAAVTNRQNTSEPDGPVPDRNSEKMLNRAQSPRLRASLRR